MGRRVEPSRTLYGADDRPERPAMFEALRLLDCRLGEASAADAPPVSTLPMSKAARQALRMSRSRERSQLS